MRPLPSQSTTPPPKTTSTPPQAGQAVAVSHPTQNKDYHNGCGTHDGYMNCRAGIGMGSNGHKTPESGNDNRSVSDYIGNSSHFYAIYQFHVVPGKPGHGQPFGCEVTGAYNGSNDKEPNIGVTLGDRRWESIRKNRRPSQGRLWRLQ